MLVAQSCLTLCDPVDCGLPGSSAHAIFQARILEWVVIPFSRDLPDPEIEPRSPALQWMLYHLSHHRSPQIGKAPGEFKIPPQTTVLLLDFGMSCEVTHSEGLLFLWIPAQPWTPHPGREPLRLRSLPPSAPLSAGSAPGHSAYRLCQGPAPHSCATSISALEGSIPGSRQLLRQRDGDKEKLKFHTTSCPFRLCNSPHSLQSLDHIGHAASEGGAVQSEELELISLTLVLLFAVARPPQACLIVPGCVKVWHPPPHLN